jgi:hypothetical protein
MYYLLALVAFTSPVRKRIAALIWRKYGWRAIVTAHMHSTPVSCPYSLETYINFGVTELLFGPWTFQLA